MTGGAPRDALSCRDLAPMGPIYPSRMFNVNDYPSEHTQFVAET
jgi:hypothetical protein